MSDGSPPRIKPWIPAAAVIAICVIVLAAAVFFGWLLLTLPAGTETDAKILAAVIGLVGVAATAMVTLGGMALKHTMDVQTEGRLRIESEHSRRLAEQAERRLELESKQNEDRAQQEAQRLRLETAIQAVTMLGTPSGAPSAEAQQAGALFALASLDQLDFALALLERLWANNKIDAVSAVWLVNRGLLAGEYTERLAVNILRDNVAKLHLGKGNYVWPDALSSAGWIPTLSAYTRERLLELRFRLMTMLPREEWDQGFLLTGLAGFYCVATMDPLRRIAQGAAYGVNVLRRALEMSTDDVIHTDRGSILVAEMERVETELLGSDGDSFEDRASDNLMELAKELALWAGIETDLDLAKYRATPLNPADPGPADPKSPPAGSGENA